MAIALRYAARSDVGLVRANNQDSGYAGPHLLVIADGMGGHAGGDIASSLAVGELAALDGESIGSPEAQTRLAGALRTANSRLLDRVVAEPQLAGMGTTVTALLRSGSRLIVAHIGDSRAYVLREGVLSQVTNDHTYVQRLVAEGQITAEEAEHHPQRSVLMRVLTGEHGDEPEVSVREGKPGDRWLLCSDGLSGVVSRDTIHDTLADGEDPGTTAQRLVQLALRAGGPDNVTVIVADVVDLDRPPSTTPQVVGAAASARQGAPPPDDTTPAARAAALTRDARGRSESGDALDAMEARQGRHRASGWGWWVVVLLVLLGLTGAAYGGWRWSQTQYYVATTEERVAVYRGLPQDLGPLRLSSIDEVTDVRLASLPPVYRQRVQDVIPVADRAEATSIVDDMRQLALGCASGYLTDAQCEDGSPASGPNGEPRTSTASAPPLPRPSATLSTQ